MLFSRTILLLVLSALPAAANVAVAQHTTEAAAAESATANSIRSVAAGDTAKLAGLPDKNQSAPGKPRLALVFSGGGARGLAQVGVLKALEEEGIRPDLIVGVSIGSIVGGLYAAGYSASRLERAVKDLDWKLLLRLSDEADRSVLAVDQKPMADRSILTLHLDGLQPMLPMAASNGQRLMNALNGLVIQGLYHSSDFDSLGIPFRAIATDLHSGSRVVLRRGNLAEVMRASSAVPVMYSPVAIDGMLLVDGGLVSNVPVDVAREAGCDIIVAVNTTSPLRTPEQLTNALETLDQVFNVMMIRQAKEMAGQADLVIEPKLYSASATDFSSPDSLIAIGYREGKAAAGRVKRLLDECERRSAADSMHGVEPQDEKASSTAFADATVTTRGSAQIPEPQMSRISGIQLKGASLLSEAVIAGIESRWKRQLLSADNKRALGEYILEEYRNRGYSLAYIRRMDVDAETGNIGVVIEEGRISKIRVTGNERTNSIVILREIPVKEGEIFRIEALERGMKNLAALPLFHSVSFDIDSVQDNPILTIRVVERTSQMLQAGVLVDNERNAQVGLLLRDASFLGTGTELRGSFFSGARNRRFAAEYHTNRMFYTPFSFTMEGYYEFRDFNSYEDVTGLPRNRFEREVTSVYRTIGYGTQAAFGLYAERFGTLQGRLRYEQQSIRTTEFRDRDAEGISESHLLVSLGITATMDTQDRYPFPRKGVYFHSDYTSAQSVLGGEVAFSRLVMAYEFYLPLQGETLVLHPRLMFGYGDKTMPRYEEFRLGGLSSFIGMRENEFNGRQIAVGSFELRYHLPFDILFDSYFSMRYDIGRTWANPELVRLGDLRHGTGLVFGLDTPIGPASFGVGRSFYPVRNNPETSVRVGPTNLYFAIGVALD